MVNLPSHLLRNACTIALLAGGALLPAAAAHAQQEVVQAMPNPAQVDLNNAMRRLSRSPNSVSALVDAGRASLELGDLPGALGFFNRAQAIAPEDGRVLTGLALLAVRRGEAVKAVQLFDNANAAGAPLIAYASDRGLAYDLIGNNARAQRLYRQALSREESNETVQRLALSYAIVGDAAASEAILLPLLQRQDRAAFRTRAFALAILGRDEDAIAIAETMLPARLSARLAPYLRYMPRLTRAQQAAAANLGKFPAVAHIGQDSPDLAELASEAQEEPTRIARNDRLTPAGEPLGRAAAPPAAPVIATPPRTEPSAGELPAIGSAQQAVVARQEAATRPLPTQQPAVQPAPAQEARPSFALAAADPAPVAQPVPDAEAETELELSEAFADFSLAERNLPVAARAGAVDVTAITPARPAPPEPAPPPPPVHPSRIWVQVATGQDVSAFRFDWRRLVRNADGLLDGREAFTARWNRTNRLVTGPFDSVREANRFVSELGEKGVSSFRFTSSEGEEVRQLD